ncbi:MAG: methylated-DNA--[protein]-cysteine S-methyltransferase [Candidatus Paceibacterota bacterium]
MEISHAFYKTDLGYVLLGHDGKGICFLQLGDTQKELLCILQTTYKNATLKQMTPTQEKKFAVLVKNLVAGKGKGNAKITLSAQGTPFQEKVWRYLEKIPVGKTRSYTDVAKAIKQPKAVRAVAGACAANRVGLLIPCHRILRSDGDFSGYRWGRNRKVTLLKREGIA